MNEFFLQFIWKHRLFTAGELKTQDGQLVDVLSPGLQNTDAGPDFFNARIRIDGTVWAGNVEIHQKASDWYRHKHEQDAAYDNVILHLVKLDDQPVINSKGLPVETLSLVYPPQLETDYADLLKSKGWIPCSDRFHLVDRMNLQIWFHSLMVERLQQKTGEIIQRLEQNKNDWNETFYQFLARNFGFKTNALPFELLAKALPLQVLGKHKYDLFQIEALLFGTAGLLNEELIGDDYFLALRKEFSVLYKKYTLKPLEGHLWKFLRLRPVNFPTVRLAQFAQLIHQSTALFSKLVEQETLADIRMLFQVQASGYWDTHYRFNKSTRQSTKHLGDDSVRNLIINTLVPFLFVYGDYHHKPALKDLALDYLEQLPPEKNSITENWNKLGVEARSAFESQALIQLKNAYCIPRKCLDCRIGTRLLSLAGVSTSENNSC
ncbi:DUF2851 family protein [Gaoshiqia sediminis]|uniref:DUF2851 family protein n=1 Tax=Gaoshiqia sediminis TaxID=2986998 RepID=A0AA42C6R7_9BACT|nr:DUF2851 family protein [Gaoshiqia sediminis]MCW0484218.1 DUF2851 family protein [Gaoshiqia sediminis]